MIRNLFSQIWACSQVLRYKRFISATQNPELAQQKVLLNLIRKNAHTTFGQSFDFAAIRSASDYTAHVPLRRWTDMQGDITAIKDGGSDILFPGKPVFFQFTTGSSGSPKAIPITANLQHEFSRALGIWIYSIKEHYPKGLYGRSYWSLSPKIITDQEFAHVSDSHYLGRVMAWFVDKTTIGTQLNTYQISSKFYRDTLMALLSTEDLSLISVWSPTFLLNVDHILRQHRHTFIGDIQGMMTISVHRKKVILETLQSPDFQWADLWPNLKVLSCWTHGTSQLWLNVLKERLGDIEIQPKGLVSTESIISIPIHPRYDPVLAIGIHFYEFLDPKSETLVPLNELKVGGTYCCVVTTGGGLYRYVTDDLIEITGFFNKTPCFKFVCRVHDAIDTVGEKMTTSQILTVITQVAAEFDMSQQALAIPIQRETGFQYHFFWVADFGKNASVIDKKIDEILSVNPHYRYARSLNQLLPPVVKQISLLHWNSMHQSIRDGLKILDGNYKPKILVLWNEVAACHHFLKVDAKHEI